MLTCWIDESSEQDARVLAAKQDREMLDPDPFADETDELLTCRAIWEILHEQTIWVMIPLLRADPVQRHHATGATPICSTT